LRRRDVLLVREPGGTPLGEALRGLLLDPRSRVDPHAEALLYAAARAQLVADVVRPALQEGRDVVCDRFVDSSLAYQGAARGLGVAEVGAVNAFATGGLLPDRTILLDLAPAAALARKDGARDRMEGADVAFHQRVRDCFVSLAASEPDRFVVIDASQPPAAVLDTALRALGALL